MEGGSDRGNPRQLALMPPLVLPAVVFVGLSYTLWRVLHSVAVHRLQSTKVGEWQSIIETLQLYSKVFPAISIAAAALLMVVLIQASRRARGGWRTLAFISVAGLGLSILADAGWWILSLTDHKNQTLRELMGHKLTYAALQTGTAVGICGGVSALLGIYGAGAPSRRINAAWPLFLWGAWGLLMGLMRVAGDPLQFPYENPVTYMLLEQAVWVSGFALTVIALRRAPAEEEYMDHAPLHDDDGDNYEYYRRWTPAADGLKLYGDALSWRVTAIVICYGLLLFAVLGKSQGLAKLIMWALPTVSVLTGIAMVTGAFRYANQPEESPGQAPAVFAAISMAIVALLDGYALLLIFKFLTADPKSYRAAREAMDAVKSAQSMTTWSLGLGFASLVVLLLSMGMVAKYLRRVDVVKALTSAGLFLVIAACVVLWFRSSPPKIKSLGEAVFFSMIILIIALSAVGFYISVVRKVEAAMRGDGAAPVPDLPAARARVVNRSDDE
jgi:hypothetical protein